MNRRALASLLALSVGLTPVAPVHAQDLDRAVGALIGAIIGGAIQEHQRQRQRQQTTRQPQRAQPARPAVSQAQRQQTRDVQTALNFFGFPAGAVDGAMGPNTRNAIRAYQQAMGFPVTGTLDATQRDFLIGSYHRARHAGAIPRDSTILQQQGPQGLLRIYRDEMRGIAAPAGPPQADAPILFGQAGAPGAPQPQIGAGSVGTPGLATPSVGGGALLGPHAVIDPELDTYRCLRTANRNAFAECLRAAGASEPAIRAAIALSRDGANVYIVEYFDIGAVDVAVLEWPAAGVGITYGFVVGNLEFLPAGELFRPMDIRDGASRSLARRHPRAAAMNVTGIVGHRFLDDGGQRFVLTTPLTDGCRACDIVGTAIGYVDFRNGRVVGSGTIGWTARQGEGHWDGDDVHRRLAARDVREMQTQLNLRGYIAGAMDGAFGPNTARALRDFRREHCLGDDAEWTTQTAALLAGGADDFDTAPCGVASRRPVATAALQVFPLREGIYARSIDYCLLDQEGFHRIGDAIGFVRQTFEDGLLHAYESSCRIDEAVEDNGQIRVRFTCDGEGETWTGYQLFENVSETGFTEIIETDPRPHEAPAIVYSEIRGNVGVRHFHHCDILTAASAAITSSRLEPGIYAEHPGQCPFSGVPEPDIATLSMVRPLSVSEGHVAWDHAGCNILGQSQAGNTFTFDLFCTGEGHSWRSTEHIERLSATDVLFRGVRFSHCGSSPVPQGAGLDGRVPLPVEDGFYAALPEACPVFDGTERSEDQQIAAGLRIMLRDGQYSRGEQSCPIVEFTEVNGLGRLSMECIYGDTAAIFNFELNPRGSSGFESQGTVYHLCAEQPTQFPEDAEASTEDMPSVADPLQDGFHLSAGFLTSADEVRHGSQLLGLELRADAGTPVLSPVSGIIIGNRTGTDVPADQRWLILRDTASGQEHVFGHLVSPLQPGEEVRAGEQLGEIASGSGGHRLHWGINRLGIWQAVDTAAGWGWEHGPAEADAEQVHARGWIDPAPQAGILMTEPAQTDASNLAASVPELLAGVAAAHEAAPAGVFAAAQVGHHMTGEATAATPTQEALELIEAHFTSALGVDSDYVQLQLRDAGFLTGELAPFGPDGRHSQWTPQVQEAFAAALDYARAHGISYDLTSENGYFAFIDSVRAHRAAGQ